MQELIPLFLGLVLGLGLGTLRPGIRLPVGAALSVAVGVLATVVTGEFKVTWGYVLVDIPLVAGAAILGLMAARQVRPTRVQ
jgi:hypothetical protein